MAKSKTVTAPVSEEMTAELERFAAEKGDVAPRAATEIVAARSIIGALNKAMPIVDAIPVDEICALVADGNSAWSVSTMSKGKGDFGAVCRELRIRQGKMEEIATLLGKEIVIQHMMSYPASIIQDDGEVVNFARWVYIGPDDKCYTGGGPFMAKSLNQFIATSGVTMPFNPPIRFIVRDMTTKRGRRIWWLEPVGFVEGGTNGGTK